MIETWSTNFSLTFPWGNPYSGLRFYYTCVKKKRGVSSYATYSILYIYSPLMTFNCILGVFPTDFLQETQESLTSN